MNGIPRKRREQAEDLLQLARVAQTEFWRSLLDLESIAGIEIQGTIDLRDITLGQLLDPKARGVILGLSEVKSGSGTTI